jgi:hypothetical protein
MGLMATLSKNGKTFVMVKWSINECPRNDQFSKIRWWHSNIKPWLDKNTTGEWFWDKRHKQFAFEKTVDAMHFKLMFHR